MTATGRWTFLRTLAFGSGAYDAAKALAADDDGQVACDGVRRVTDGRLAMCDPCEGHNFRAMWGRGRGG